MDPWLRLEGKNPLPTFGLFHRFPRSSGNFLSKTHAASVAVVVEGVVPDVYQGRKPQEVIQRQLAVAEALAARKEALMDEALP